MNSCLIFHRVFHEGVENNLTETQMRIKKKYRPYRAATSEQTFLSQPLPPAILINIKVGVHILHVIMIFQHFHQANHGASSRSLQLDVFAESWSRWKNLA